jgi:hypothetical protein
VNTQCSFIPFIADTGQHGTNTMNAGIVLVYLHLRLQAEFRPGAFLLSSVIYQQIIDTWLCAHLSSLSLGHNTTLNRHVKSIQYDYRTQCIPGYMTYHSSMSTLRVRVGVVSCDRVTVTIGTSVEATSMLRWFFVIYSTHICNLDLTSYRRLNEPSSHCFLGQMYKARSNKARCLPQIIQGTPQIRLNQTLD